MHVCLCCRAIVGGWLRMIRHVGCSGRLGGVGGWLGLVMLASWGGVAQAQGFAAYVSPPRFEVKVAPGQTLRQVLDIQHMGQGTARYRIYTADWAFQPDGSVLFREELTPGSCRPWVAIERRELSLASRMRFRFRFEISVPADAAAQECRFALMIEGEDTTVVRQSGVDIPVSGRVGIMVYASVGGAEPQIRIDALKVVEVNGRKLPVLVVSNQGQAHGRLSGFLTGEDAAGQTLDMAPADAPILPGVTRSIAVQPVVQEGQPVPVIRYPLKLRGTLEIGKQRLPLEHRFEP